MKKSSVPCRSVRGGPKGAESSRQLLLDLGVHLGLPKRASHAKIEPYLYGKRWNYCVIDLEQTLVLLRRAVRFVRLLSAKGGAEGAKILFVDSRGTFTEIIKQTAQKCGPSVQVITTRWIGGSLCRLANLPQAIFLLDGNEMVVREAHALCIPVIAIMDGEVCAQSAPRATHPAYPIPGNIDSEDVISFYCWTILSALKRQTATR